MRRRGLVSQLYRTARLANDVSAITSGNPDRIARRAKNKIVGRAIARAGLWRLLWALSFCVHTMECHEEGPRR